MSDTFVYLGVTYTIKYVDATASGANNGSSITDALTSLPAPASMTANTAYLCRRTTSALTWSTGTCANSNVMVLGCPREGDALYDLMPSAVTGSAWPTETDDYAVLNTNSTTATAIFTGADVRFHRIEYYRPNTGSSYTGGTLALTGLRPWITNCYGHLGGIDIDTTSAASLPTSNANYPLQISNLNATLSDCEFQSEGYSPVQFAAASVIAGLVCTRCAFKSWGAATTSTAATMFGAAAGSSVGITTMYGYAEISDCTFYSLAVPTRASFASVSSMAYNYSFTQWTRCTFTHDGSLYTSSVGANPWFVINTSGRVDLTDCTFSITTAGGNSAVMTGAGYIRMKNCTVTAAIASGANYCTFLSGSPTSAVFSDCSITADGGIVGSSLTQMGNIWYERCSFHGAVNVNYNLHMVNLTNTTQIDAISVSGGGILYIENLSLSVSHQTIALVDCGFIYIDSCSVYPTVTHAQTASAYYCRNEGGVTGRWHATSKYFDLATNTTYRSGGAKTYSIKGTHISAPSGSRVPLWIAPKPWAGIEVAFGTTGKKKISIYFAYKLYSTFDISNILAEVEYLAEATGSVVTSACSRGNGQLVDDSSTWIGDSGLTIKRLDIFFELLQASSVYVRIGWQNYDAAGGYTLIDPAPVGFDL